MARHSPHGDSILTATRHCRCQIPADNVEQVRSAVTLGICPRGSRIQPLAGVILIIVLCLAATSRRWYKTEKECG